MNFKDIAELFETYANDALIGATIGSLIPGRPPIGDRSKTAITVVVVWTIIGVFIHFVCRLFRGKARSTAPS